MLNRFACSTFFMFILSCLSPATDCIGMTAVNWQALGFPTQITSDNDYDQTVLNYHVSFTPKNKDELGVFDPVILHSITGGGTPPISNFAPFPAFDINVTANSSKPKLEINISGATSSDFVLAPGQYLFLGGFDTNVISAIDQFQFSQLGGGSVAATQFTATTTYEVNSTESDALSWDPVGKELDFTPSMGTTGVIFLRNDSGLFIDSIKFEIDYTADTSFYIGSTIPEPSTYLTLIGMILVCLGFATIKRKKCHS